MAAQLVHLPEVERLSATCIRILGGNPSKFTLQGTNTYLVGTGPSRLLIDTGEGRPSWIAALKRTLAAEQASVGTVLLTHWHHDHVGGVPDLVRFSPATLVRKRQGGGGGSGPDWLGIDDGQTFRVEGASLTALHTPGHAVDHTVFVLEEEDALFTGDNVLGQGTTVFEDLGTYLKSLAKMKTLVSGRAYPGHGPVLPDAPAKISEYILHRQQRETQLLQTLASLKTSGQGLPGGATSAWTPMELVKVIYQAYPESLHQPAVGGLIQILHKLQAEDKVVLEEGSWRLKDRSSL